MTRADTIVEKGADRLQALARKAAGSGGLAARLAEPLAEDAAFLRKLKPSLIAARARGKAPTNEKPGAVSMPPAGESSARAKRRGGPSPLVVVGAAFAVGILVAKILDWRGHAHPRD